MLKRGLILVFLFTTGDFSSQVSFTWKYRLSWEVPVHQSSNYGSKPTARYRKQHYCWHQQRLIFLLCCCNTGLFVLPVKNELSRLGFQALALCEWAEVLRSSDCESDCWQMVVAIPGMWYGARENLVKGECVCLCVRERDTGIDLEVSGHVWLQRTCKVTQWGMMLIS